jgi:hypothetical protein
MVEERFLAPVELTLRRADPSDIPFIMHTERIAGYEGLIGRWDEAQHRAALGDHRSGGMPKALFAMRKLKAVMPTDCTCSSLRG